MIQEISIKNFRSIAQDTIRFDNPVTVVIGPNGTGKTNLIYALKFVATCVKESPVRAIQRAGGLDKVFTVKERRAQKCSFKVKIEYPKDYAPTENAFLEYYFELKYDEKIRRVIVSSEYLTSNYEINGLAETVTLLNKRFDGKKHSISGVIHSKFGEDSKIFQRVGDIAKSQLLLDKLANDFYLPAAHGQVEMILVEYVCEVLNSIVGFNIDPQQLRRSSDLLSKSEISYDGRGFSGLVNRLLDQEGLFVRDIRQFPRRRVNRVSGQAIIERLAMAYEGVLPFLHSIKTDEEIDSTTVNLSFTETHQIKTQKRFSSEHLSDGTLKYLALALLVLVPNYSFMYIEELENYLNPRAIRALVQLMKDNAIPVKFLITSHSETVLNQMKASEILISRRGVDGETTYTKFIDVDQIGDVLDGTGMSLGTYWAKGGLDAF